MHLREDLMDVSDQPITSQIELMRSADTANKKNAVGETEENLPEPKIINTANKWSWSSWLLGAPPLAPTQETIDGSTNQQSQVQDNMATDEEQSDSLQETANWLWSGASHLVLAAAEKSSLLLSNTIREDEEITADIEVQQPLEEVEPNVDIWCNVKHDLNEVACALLPKDVNSSQISDAVYKLGNTVTACWDGITSAAVSTFQMSEWETEVSQLDENLRQMDSLLLDASTFHNPPHPQEEYERWLQNLQPLTPEEIVDSHSETLSALLINHSSVSSAYCQLVPRQLSYVDFFLRYLFRKHQLESSSQVPQSYSETSHRGNELSRQAVSKQNSSDLQEHNELELIRCSTNATAIPHPQLSPEGLKILKQECVHSTKCYGDEESNEELKESEDDWEKCG